MIILSYAVAGLGLSIVAGEKAGKDVGTLTGIFKGACAGAVLYGLYKILLILLPMML
ncbi:hypothetical protein [Bacillus thuringiensis]|uniref:hypothetical protein n=1 Tax=Bacillus thuringiensis TaxID=1428 RepID=UPI00148245BB|nr:hypothetical protein [Bacillus thuringiensis]